MKNLKIAIIVLLTFVVAIGAVWYFSFFLKRPAKKTLLPEEKLNFEERISKLSDSQKLVDYLNKNFNFETKEKNKALAPREFFEKREGSPEDFAVFSAFVLNKHNNEALVIRYKYQQNSKDRINTITVFREGEKPEYITFSKSGARIFDAGNSFEDTFSAEDKRLNIQVTDYKVFLPGDTDFTKKEWTKRGEH